METLLVVEDEADIRELLSFNLEMSGYTVIKTADGQEGLKMARRHAPDLIILDIMLPGVDGFQFCRNLRKRTETRNIPVLMLTARAEEEDQIKGFDAGADDYVTKPFSPRVLTARVEALLRRKMAKEERDTGSILEIHGIKIDSVRHEVKEASGRMKPFSATEFAVLHLLASNPGQVFPRHQIIDSVKGENYPATDRSVDVQILGIRRKLGKKSDCIETVRGIGYRMRED